MLFRATTFKDMNNNAFTVFIVLLAISLSILSVRVLNKAAAGDIGVSSVFIIFVLSTFSIMPYLVQITTVFTVLQTFQRLYAESEMVIWETSRLSLFRWVRVVMQLAIPMTLLMVILVVFVRPWSFAMQKKMDEQFKSQNQMINTSPGVFRSFGFGMGTLYVEAEDSATHDIRHVMMFRPTIDESTQAILTAKNASLHNTPPPFHLIVAQTGVVKGEQDGLIEFNNGLFYAVDFVENQYQQGLAKPNATIQTNLDMAYFESMSVSTKTPFQVKTPNIDSMPIWELWLINSPQSRAEIYWRASICVETIILSLLALVLSYSAPRKRNYMNYIVLLLVGMAYNNTIKMGQSMISQDLVNGWVFFVGLHGLCAVAVFALLWLRSYRVSWRRVGRRFGVPV